MTPEVIQAFITSGRPVRFIWTDSKGYERVTVTTLDFLDVESGTVSDVEGGDVWEYGRITSIGRADAPDDDGVQ